MKEKAAIVGGLISRLGAALGPLTPTGRGSDGAFPTLTTVRRQQNPRPPGTPDRCADEVIGVRARPTARSKQRFAGWPADQSLSVEILNGFV